MHQTIIPAQSVFETPAPAGDVICEPFKMDIGHWLRNFSGELFSIVWKDRTKSIQMLDKKTQEFTHTFLPSVQALSR